MLTILGSIVILRGGGRGNYMTIQWAQGYSFDTKEEIYMIFKKLPWLLFRLANHLILIVCFISIKEVGYSEKIKTNHLRPINLTKRERKREECQMCVHIDMWCDLPNKTFEEIGNGNDYMIHL